MGYITKMVFFFISAEQSPLDFFVVSSLKLNPLLQAICHESVLHRSDPCKK